MSHHHLPSDAPKQCFAAMALIDELEEAKRISHFEAKGLRQGVWPLSDRVWTRVGMAGEPLLMVRGKDQGVLAPQS